MINTSKGPAVRALRVQCDKKLYRAHMQQTLRAQPGLVIAAGTVDRILTDHGAVSGIITAQGQQMAARSVILTSGTFLKGLIHIGLNLLDVGIPELRALG